MKRLRVGINGFGRIGRALFRINYEQKAFDIVAINDINPDTKNLAYLLQYDTSYGRFVAKVTNSENRLFMGDQNIPVHHEAGISHVPWDEYGVDIVVDASGIKKNLSLMQESSAKVKNYLITHSPEMDVQNIILGVNEHELDVRKNKIISASICDAVALSPIIRIVQQTRRMTSGYLATLHSWLSYQNLLDGPSVSWSQPGDVYSHYALGRATPQNIIPKSTSAVTAAGKVIPGIEQVLQSFSFRVPTPVVSSAFLVFMLDKEITKQELIDQFQQYEKTQTFKIVHNSEEPLTSVDYMRQEYSAMIDHRWTSVVGRRHVKLVYWYDNEWGYSSRVVDILKLMAQQYA